MWGLSFKPGTEDMRDSASIYFVENIDITKMKEGIYKLLELLESL